MGLKGKTAIITGAAQGIGAACAKRFADEGVNVVLADIADQHGEKTLSEIKEAGGKAIYVHCDSSNKTAIDALIESTLTEFNRIDIGICAAGIAPSTDFLEVNEDELRKTLDINLIGPFLLGQGIAAHLVENQKPGSIINITSTSAYQSGPSQLSYTASKAGLGAITRTMAVALAPHKIRVNAVAPGPTRTGLMAQALERNPDLAKPILARTPLGIAEPSEIAGAVVFLASDDASFVTGETINVDGGRLVLNYTVPESAQQ